MKVTNFKKKGGKWVKIIETEGLPKEKIKIVECEGHRGKEEICDIFGKGKVTIIFEPNRGD